MDQLAKVPLYKIANDSFIPMIGFGTYQLKGQDCIIGTQTAINLGYRHIDTASIYRNDKEISQVLQQIYKTTNLQRKDFFITSKIAPAEQGYDNAQQACKEILAGLNTEYLDLLLIHWPGVAKLKPESPQNQEIRLQTWKALELLKEQGLVKNIGVSNFLINHLEHLIKNSKEKPAVNQFELHPLLQEKELIQYCRNNNIAIEAYSPLARADDKLLKNEILINMAKKYGKTVSQVALRWGIQNNFIILPKSKTEKYIQENLQIFDFQLNDNDMKMINEMNINLHTCWNPHVVQ